MSFIREQSPPYGPMEQPNAMLGILAPPSLLGLLGREPTSAIYVRDFRGRGWKMKATKIVEQQPNSWGCSWN